jgi:rare lipoprotein A
MVARFRAAICGTAILIVCTSAAIARTETGNVPAGSASAAVVGAASMYDPYRPGYKSGTGETASGERYDPSAWAAAIQINLRGKFGGVRHGTKLRYALVEGAGKKVIVKINDVGPLEPGRVIDFDRQTMRYFDPSLQRGLIHNVKVTPLSGDHYTPGPIGEKSSEPTASPAARPGQGVRWVRKSTNRAYHIVGRVRRQVSGNDNG